MSGASARHVHPFVGDFVDAEHRSLSELPSDDGLIRGAVPGYLRPADALVLYELAYFTIGDVLERARALATAREPAADHGSMPTRARVLELIARASPPSGGEKLRGI